MKDSQRRAMFAKLQGRGVQPYYDTSTTPASKLEKYEHKPKLTKVSDKEAEKINKELFFRKREEARIAREIEERKAKTQKEEHELLEQEAKIRKEREDSKKYWEERKQNLKTAPSRALEYERKHGKSQLKGFQKFLNKLQ